MLCFTITFSWTSILLLCLRCHHTNAAHPSDENDFMGRMDKEKLMTLAEELLKDAKVKQRHIHIIRNSHNSLLAYDIGLIIGKIREKYKRMMDIYREAHDRKTNRTKLIPPTVRDFKLLHWIVSMELVHTMEVDIDKLVNVLETIPKGSLKSAAETAKRHGEAKLAKPAKPPSLREGPATTPPELTPKPKFLNEDELKQHYREQYKMRSGRDANWTLDEYYGVI